MKVKPMINGIEVKVGQVWADAAGCKSIIDEVYEDGSFVDNYDIPYECDGVASTEDSHCNLVALLKGVDSVKEIPDYNFKVKSEPETTYGESTSLSERLAAIRKVTVQPKATFTESEINAKINEVIKDFDWQKAASIYTALGWTWYEIEGVPTIGDLVVKSIEHMRQAVQIAVANKDEGYVSSGGLIGRAYITDGKLAVSLEMQVTEASSGY